MELATGRRGNPGAPGRAERGEPMPWRVALVGLLLTGALVAPAAASADPAGPVLWRTHFASGLSKWTADGCGGDFNSGGGRVEVTADEARSGRFAAVLRLPDAREREQGARLFRWCEPRQHRALYYSAWYHLPRQYRVDGWWSLMEWKSEGSHNAKFMLNVGNRPDGTMYLYLGRGEDSGGGSWLQDAKDLPAGRWVHVEAYYEKAADDGGRVAVWQDGVKLVEVDGVQTANGNNLGWAVVSYGEGIAPGEVVVHVDDAAVGTSRVDP